MHPTEDARKKFRENILRKHCAPRILALIATYYPLILREKILACCKRQLAGDMRRTCRSHLCPACNSRESHSISAAQYARFQACTPPGKPVRLAHEVYTLPPHLRPYILTKEGFTGWKRATLQTVRDHHGSDVAGIMNIHSIGDSDFAEFHPHWDIVLNGYVLKDGKPRLHRPQRPDFDKVRAEYIRNLAREMHLNEVMIPRKIDLHIGVKPQFHTAERKTRHMVRYSSRHVYLPHRAWLNDRGTTGDWWYKPREGSRDVRVYEGKNAIVALMSHDVKLESRKRRVWFGHMQNRLCKTAADAFARSVTSEVDDP